MVEQFKRLEEIEKEIALRKRVTPFREGVYVIRHPLTLLIKPQLILRFNKKGTKVKGEIKWFGWHKKLTMLKLQGEQILFGFRVEIIDIDLVVKFYRRDAFEGFFDLPIGSIRFTGHYKESLYK